MSENQQEQAAIVGFILAATRGSEQLINFGRNQLLPPIHCFLRVYQHVCRKSPLDVMPIIGHSTYIGSYYSLGFSLLQNTTLHQLFSVFFNA
jgi:hypothetical protein